MSGCDTQVFQPEYVPFRGDSIACIRGTDAESARVVLNQTCESMGLDFGAQLRRLKRHKWPSMVMMTIVAQDGRTREVATLPVKQVPMWLATVEASRIGDQAIREKVELYQDEAADALHRHFFGAPSAEAGFLPVDPRIAAARQLLAVVERQVDQEQRLASVEAEAAATLATASRALALASGDTGFVTMRGFCKIHNLRRSEEELNKMGQWLSRRGKAEGVDIKKVDDEGWGWVNRYPKEFLGRHLDYIRDFKL